MAGPVPAVHVLLGEADQAWMPGTRPGMTIDRSMLAPFAVFWPVTHDDDADQKCRARSALAIEAA